MIKKKIQPYLLISVLLFFLFQIGYHYYEASTEAVPFFGVERFEWLADNMGEHDWFDFSFSSTSLFVGFIGFLLPLLIYATGDKGVYRTGEEHGSARFAKPSEMKRFEDVDSEKNMIFSKQVRMGLFNFRLAYNVQLNKNVVVIGLPGDGKTFTFVLPNIMQLNSSFVITDPKGDLAHEVGHLLERHGWAVKILDLIHLTNSDRFNPFYYMRNELDIDRIAEAITEGTKKSDHQGEDFWVQAELMLQRALLGYLYFDCRDEETGHRLYMPSLAHVSDLLKHIGREDPDTPSPVEQMFEELNERYPNNYAYKQWQLFKNARGETKASVIYILATRYSLFDHEDVRRLISEDTLEIDTWNTKKTAVFIAIPETNNSFNFLSSILFALGFDVLIRKADDILQGKVKGKSRNDLLHIQFILDEFAQIGRIPNFTQFLSSVRSREMSIKIILQAVNQLQTVYKNEWKTIFNNCATHVFLGTNDKDTMDYYSARSGKQTIRVRNYSKSYSSRSGSSSENRQSQGRPLMTPDEIARIGIDEALVFISKQYVVRDKKASVLDHPYAQEIAHSPEDATWYDYVRTGTDINDFIVNATDLSPEFVATQTAA